MPGMRSGDQRSVQELHSLRISVKEAKRNCFKGAPEQNLADEVDISRYTVEITGIEFY